HLPNPGRLKELLAPGARVILRKIRSQKRKTRFDLIGVNHGDTLVSVDSGVPNKLFREAFEKKAMEEFAAYESIKPEYRYGGSRVDFLLQGSGGKCLLEVKSCTLVKGGVALFPDAVTKRGTRHVYELAKALKEGYRAAVLFIVQRPDAEVFSPNDETDERFSEALRDAWRRGVDVYAYSAEFVGGEINLKERLQVKL
ncbi:MAG: DNA/RNA nuclease SfsA, partial [Candidatus Zixiibacteriota bacterium]